MFQKGNCPWHLITMKSKNIYVGNIFTETAEIETGMAGKSNWDQAYGRQKTWFGLENQKENQPNHQRLLLLTVLPLNYFMAKSYRHKVEGTTVQYFGASMGRERLRISQVPHLKLESDPVAIRGRIIYHAIVYCMCKLSHIL